MDVAILSIVDKSKSASKIANRISMTGKRYMVSWRRSETQYLLMRVEVEGSPIPECSRFNEVGGHFRGRKIPTYL